MAAKPTPSLASTAWSTMTWDQVVKLYPVTIGIGLTIFFGWWLARASAADHVEDLRKENAWLRAQVERMAP